MKLIRLFVSTAIFAASVTAAACWLFPMIMGEFPLTAAGFSLSFQAISWLLVAVIAAVFGILRVLSEFEMFNWLANFFYWVDVIFKAFR